MRWLAIAFVLMSDVAQASDYPLSGTVGHETEKDFITFECTQSSQERLDCLFAQIKIRRMGGPEALAKALAQIPKMLTEVRAGKLLNKDECSQYRELASAIDSGKPLASMAPTQVSEFLRTRKAMPQAERSDMLKIMTAWIRACDEPSAASIETWLRIVQDRESRTCKLWAHNYNLSFRQVGPNWVSSEGPAGACGTVTVVTLSRDDPQSPLWNYAQQKIITNKGGGNGFFKCQDLDEASYLYRWDVTEYYKGCDYIKYGF
jgi:hypothetical protein